MKNGILILILFLLALSPSALLAADMRPVIDGVGNFRLVVIEGAIEKGDFDRFIKIIEENQGEVSGIYLFSPGGDFDEAMKIGRALNQFELSSQVPMQSRNGTAICDGTYSRPTPQNKDNCTCASACFFIHIGAFHRGGTFLAVHRPYFEIGAFGQLSEQSAKVEFDGLQSRARRYMEEMHVPTHIQDSILATSSDSILLLDENTVRTHFWGKPPHVDEWVKNKCSQIETPVQTDDYDPFQTKEHKMLECAVSIEKQRRMTAYRKYFGKEGNISDSQDFSAWSNATKYLGKDFYEIKSQERFEEEEFRSKYANTTSLSRAATSKMPFIFLSDSEKKLRMVSEITLLSPENPPSDFGDKLLETLSKNWGEPLREAQGWSWKNSGFQAALNKRYMGDRWVWQLKISDF